MIFSLVSDDPYVMVTAQLASVAVLLGLAYLALKKGHDKAYDKSWDRTIGQFAMRILMLALGIQLGYGAIFLVLDMLNYSAWAFPLVIFLTPGFDLLTLSIEFMRPELHEDSPSSMIASDRV